jgi:hypothetical protein
MPRHARNNSGLGRLRPIGQWLGVFAFTFGLAAWEAVRIADARATVASGWATGIAAGAGGGLVLAAVAAVAVLAQRQRPSSRRGGRQAAIPILTIALLLFVGFITSTPVRQLQPHPAPYVITSGVEVAEIAYVGLCFAGLALGVMAAALVALVRERRPS